MLSDCLIITLSENINVRGASPFSVVDKKALYNKENNHHHVAPNHGPRGIIEREGPVCAVHHVVA